MSSPVKSDYEDLGDVSIDEANHANVPVNIWLAPAEDADNEPIAGLWELRADNYMPRRMYIDQNSYRAQSKDRAVLVELVRKYWLPLYQIAVDVLSSLDPDADGAASLYYWKAP